MCPGNPTEPGVRYTVVSESHPGPRSVSSEALTPFHCYQSYVESVQTDPRPSVSQPTICTPTGAHGTADQRSTTSNAPVVVTCTAALTSGAHPVLPTSVTTVASSLAGPVETAAAGAVLSITETPQSPSVSLTAQVAPPAMTRLGAMPFAMPMLGQLPPIPRFTGDGHESGESFAEWHEHFENVAKLVGWDDHWKLVHLTSCLRDTASAFHHSCGVDVRSNYQSLVAAMKWRFTPVRLTAIQAQIFHNRQQGASETVDQFAQELRKFFNLAYAGAACEGPQAERMGQTLLKDQFVAGLRPELKRKLIEVDAGLEELILKAKFEEAKSVELTVKKSQTRDTLTPKTVQTTGGTITASVPVTSTRSGPTSSVGTRSGKVKCFNCGMESHIVRNCPYPRKGRREEEAHGQRRGTTMSALVGDEDDLEERVRELEQRLQEARVKLAVHGRLQMNTMSVGGQCDKSVLAEVRVNGGPTQTLIDTGSPATTVSLDYVLDLFSADKREGQTADDSRKETLQ